MKKRIFTMGVAAALVLSVCCGAACAAEARASKTLSFYDAGASRGSNKSEVKINYDVQASKIADEVGISSIVIYKSDDTYVTTITGTTKNGLVRTDTMRHRSTYVYEGDPGTSYYAVVTGYATVGADSDSRTVTTDTV